MRDADIRADYSGVTGDSPYTASANKFFHGDVADFRFWHRTLSVRFPPVTLSSTALIVFLIYF